MIEMTVVPLRLDLRGTVYSRGDIVRFDKIYIDGFPMYRLWPYHYCVSHKPECFEWFTPQQVEGMQPHWLTKQMRLIE